MIKIKIQLFESRDKCREEIYKLDYETRGEIKPYLQFVGFRRYELSGTDFLKLINALEKVIGHIIDYELLKDFLIIAKNMPEDSIFHIGVQCMSWGLEMEIYGVCIDEKYYEIARGIRNIETNSDIVKAEAVVKHILLKNGVVMSTISDNSRIYYCFTCL